MELFVFDSIDKESLGDKCKNNHGYRISKHELSGNGPNVPTKICGMSDIAIDAMGDEDVTGMTGETDEMGE